MKICLTSVSENLDGEIDSRFGRCKYFIVVDPKSMSFKSIQNLANTSGSGAGIQAAQTLVNENVNILITGNVGPKAFHALSMAGIKIITGVSGKMRKAIENYNDGLLSATEKPSVGEHFGINY
jgi:predicted Fe-Mo cluster-binding NifX family protein